MNAQTSNEIRYIFAALCLAFEAVGILLTLCALTFNERAEPKAGGGVAELTMDQMRREAMELSDQRANLLKSRAFLISTQVLLYVSLISGLVINFPPVYPFAVTLSILALAIATPYSIKPWTSANRIAVFKRGLGKRIDSGYFPFKSGVEADIDRIVHLSNSEWREITQLVESPERREPAPPKTAPAEPEPDV
jgi:hypothetical protein